MSITERSPLGVAQQPGLRPGRSQGGREPIHRRRSYERAKPEHDMSVRTLSAPSTRVRLASGLIYEERLSAERHRRLQLGLLHQHTEGYVEVAAGRRRAGGKLRLYSRADPQNFVAGGLEAVAALAASHAARGDEVFVGPAPRSRPQATKEAVDGTRVLWVDIDDPRELPRLWQFLERRPAHLIVESGGSGGVHVYWLLEATLPARVVDAATGEISEPIERAHARLIHHLGADPQCKDRTRVLRLAGTVNHKSGQNARVQWADFALARYDVRALVGDLCDPPAARLPRLIGRASNHEDPYKRIAPPEYFWRLAGIEVPASGRVSCPHPDHPDRDPSCDVAPHPEVGWICRSCPFEARGAIYDLASALDRGPSGSGRLRDEDFKRAKARVVEVFGAR